MGQGGTSRKKEGGTAAKAGCLEVCRGIRTLQSGCCRRGGAEGGSDWQEHVHCAHTTKHLGLNQALSGRGDGDTEAFA